MYDVGGIRLANESIAAENFFRMLDGSSVLSGGGGSVIQQMVFRHTALCCKTHL